MPDTPKRDNPVQKEVGSLRGVEAPQPSEVDVVQALVEIEQATQKPQPQTTVPVCEATAKGSWFTGRGAAVLYLSIVFAVILALGWGVQRGANILSSAMRAANSSRASVTVRRPANPVLQTNAERLLERLGRGDRGAAEEIAAHSADWTGKTQSTQRTDELLNVAINSNDMRIREASIQAQLALEGIPENETGLEKLKSAVADPNLRIRSLWMLGALGNRGVDPVHVAKILESYLSDPDIEVRSWALNGLSLVATDETIPMLLDRFRNDPSPIVQERAACGLAESGMYSHAQRMVAAKSFVAWLDDSLLTAQQHIWTLQALHDIAGASPASSDSASAWRDWWSQNSYR